VNKRFCLVLAVFSCAVSAGCDLGDVCDPGYKEEYGACLRIPMPAPDGGSKRADAAASDAAASTGGSAEIGDECEAEGDCANGLRCGAPMLAYCTRANCLEPGSEGCPSDWTCLDVTGFSPDPAVGSICLRP